MLASVVLRLCDSNADGESALELHGAALKSGFRGVRALWRIRGFYVSEKFFRMWSSVANNPSWKNPSRQGQLILPSLQRMKDVRVIVQRFGAVT